MFQRQVHARRDIMKFIAARSFCPQTTGRLIIAAA